jgi:hypothetical protein
MAKQRPLRGEAVEVGRSQNGMTPATEMIAPLFVGAEDQDIGSHAHAG